MTRTLDGPLAGKSALPILYSFRRCPYAMRARLALAASGQSCELREVVLRDKPQALLDASPKATVPVLVLPGGEVIEQSLDIMRWALRQSDPGGWLVPPQGTPEAMQALIAVNDGAFKHALDRYKYPNRYALEHGGDPERFAAIHRASAAQWLMSLHTRLLHHAWLLGPNACLADMAILPFVRQFAITDMPWFEQQPWPALQRWLADWLASDLLDRTMIKHPPWEPGSAGTAFP